MARAGPAEDRTGTAGGHQSHHPQEPRPEPLAVAGGPGRAIEVRPGRGIEEALTNGFAWRESNGVICGALASSVCWDLLRLERAARPPAVCHWRRRGSLADTWCVQLGAKRR